MSSSAYQNQLFAAASSSSVPYDALEFALANIQEQVEVQNLLAEELDREVAYETDVSLASGQYADLGQLYANADQLNTEWAATDPNDESFNPRTNAYYGEIEALNSRHRAILWIHQNLDSDVQREVAWSTISNWDSQLDSLNELSPSITPTTSWRTQADYFLTQGLIHTEDIDSPDSVDTPGASTSAAPITTISVGNPDDDNDDISIEYDEQAAYEFAHPFAPNTWGPGKFELAIQ